MQAGRGRALLGSQLGLWVGVNLVAHAAALLWTGPKGLGSAGAGLAWSLLFALAFWYPWVLRPASRRPGLLWAFWSLWLLWLLVAVGHRAFLGIYPDHGTAEFSLSEPFYALVLARDRLSVWMLAPAALAVGGGWLLSKGHAGPRWPKPLRWLGLLAAAGLLVFFDKADLSPKAMGADVTTLRMLSETRLRRVGGGGLRRALAREAVKPGPPPPFHVLLLVHESLNRDAFDPELMPGLGARVAKGELLRFPKAYAAASMTDVALPSLFAGLSPAQPSADFHRVALPWHHAKAHGMATALFSVQRFNYYGFRDYFLADGLDAWSSADQAGLRLVNDTGGDDGLLVARLDAWLKARKGAPTFTVLHFNATHAPYLQVQGCTPWTEADVARRRPGLAPARRVEVARYWNALGYLDRVQERVLETLAREGLLARTLVIATSDHGECFEGAPRGRTEDLRPGALEVPLWMRLPEGFPPAWRAALEANAGRLVSNLDLAPTLAALLGDAASPAWPGASLLSPLPPASRAILAHNSGEIRARKPAVAALLWEEGEGLATWRWHAQEGAVFERFDGQRGLPAEASPERRARVQRALAEHPLLARAGARLGS